MAYFRCNLGGGGTMSETPLWTNSSPTGSQSATTVTLSQSMQNFTFLKVKWRFNTSSQNDRESWIPVSEFSGGYYTGTPNARFVVGYIGESYRYARHLSYSSDTKVGISSNIRFTTSAASVKNDNIIVTQICGVKIS